MRILIDPLQLKRYADHLHQTAHGYRTVARDLAGRPLPAMPSSIAAYVGYVLASVPSTLDGVAIDGDLDAIDLKGRAAFIQAMEAGGGRRWWRFAPGLLPLPPWIIALRALTGDPFLSWQRRLFDYQGGLSWLSDRKGFVTLGGRRVPWRVAQEAMLGVSASGAANWKFGRDGFEAGIEGEAFAGARYSVAAEIGSELVNARASGSVMIGATASGRASFSAGRGGVGAHAGGEVFVGGRAEGSVEANVAGVTGRAKGSVSYGIGATAKADVDVGIKKVKVRAEIGATLGLGGNIAIDVEVSPEKVIKSVGSVVSKLKPPKVDFSPWN